MVSSQDITIDGVMIYTNARLDEGYVNNCLTKSALVDWFDTSHWYKHKINIICFSKMFIAMI